MEKLTVIIPTKNEETNIEAVLQTVQFADEIMIVDSLSTDKTVEIARKYTDFILLHKFMGHAAQKNWAIPQATHEWILLVDADERVTPELQKEIQEILTKNPDNAGFWIYRANYFMGKPVNYSGWQSDKVIRLFRKSKCRYNNKRVHEEIIANGEVGVLKNKLKHNTYKGFDEYIKKSVRYTTWKAQDRLPKTSKVTLYHLFIKPGFRFFRHYILKKGYRDGVVGFVISMLSAFSIFATYVKIWILKKEQNKNEKKE